MRANSSQAREQLNFELPNCDPECIDIIKRLTAVIGINRLSAHQLENTKKPEYQATYNTLFNKCLGRKNIRGARSLNFDCVGESLCPEEFRALKDSWDKSHSINENPEQWRKFCRCLDNTISDFFFGISPTSDRTSKLNNILFK